MKTKLALALLLASAVGAALLPPEAAVAYPEPSVAPRAWQLDFTYGRPQLISIRGAGGDTQWFWYVPYKVVNHTDDERLFVPEITIATDQGNIMPAGRNVPGSVFDAIKQRLGNRLLETPARVVGQLLIGEDAAKESVIMFPAFGREVREVRIFVTGLSGETETIQNPATNEPVVLRKTLMLTYSTPAVNKLVEGLSLTPKDRSWVMR
jgi:hypothetical protein